MNKPTFMIVGAQKAGTTSLYAMLAQHPEVFMSTPKEPGYFIRGFPDEERWQTLKRPGPGGEIQDLENVDMGVFTADAYAKLFASPEAGTATHRGEASTPYLPSPFAAERIFETCPEARIIIVLRDPVARAYSAWGYNASRGNECAATFEEAIAQELAGERDKFVYGWRYLYTGLYSQHLKRFYDRFGRDRVLTLKFEDFRSDSQKVFDRVCEFLDLPAYEVSTGSKENVTVHHTNKTLGAIRNAFVQPGIVKSVVKPLIPSALRGKIRRDVTKAVDRYASKPEPISDATKARLVEYYSEDCRKVQDMVSFDISDWAPMAGDGARNG